MAVARDSQWFATRLRSVSGVGDAAERVYEAGQQLLDRRLDLWLAQARLMARGGAGVAMAGLLALAGWFYVWAGVIDALAREHPRFAVQIAVGALHIALGGALFLAFRRAGRSGSE